MVAPAKRKTDENKPGETDFAAALKMIAGLPLSDEERAEAVRRLLKDAGRQANRLGGRET